MMATVKTFEVIVSTLSLGTTGSVASLLAATFYQGNQIGHTRYGISQVYKQEIVNIKTPSVLCHNIKREIEKRVGKFVLQQAINEFYQQAVFCCPIMCLYVLTSVL